MITEYTEDEDTFPVVENFLVREGVHGEHDPEWCNSFLPNSTNGADNRWMALDQHLHHEFGFFSTEDTTFQRMVTVQDLINMYYVYNNYPDACPDKYGIYLWIQNMHLPQNLSDEVSKVLSSYLNRY